ncbi:uncharacterized [Tachysurus ichikawai]
MREEQVRLFGASKQLSFCFPENMAHKFPFKFRKSSYSVPFETLWLADGASPTGADGQKSQARQGCLEEDVSPPLITSSSSFWVPDGAPAVRQLKRASEKRVFQDAERTDGGLETELKVSRVKNGRML